MVRLAALAMVLLAELGCARGAPIAWPPPESGPLRDVWVVRHGWHTRIAVRRADVDPLIWPESQALGPVAYVEVGWGDRDFYPADDPSIWDAIDAVIRPTPAALHVGGFDPPPPAFLPGNAMVRVPVPAESFERLTRYLHDSYERTAAGDPIAIRPGYYPRSRFYLATGSYHAFNTSNTWTARALQVAGAPVTPAGTVTAGRVMAQARRIGQAIQPAGAGRGAQPALDAARPGADNTLRSTPSAAEDRTMDSSTNGLGLEPEEIRARVARWTEETRYIERRLQEVEERAARLTDVDRTTARLQREVEILLGENRRLREERAEIAAAARAIVNFPVLNELLKRLATPGA